MATWPNGVFLQTGGNYGFGGGSNRGARIARGKYLFFLNPDVWLEPNCLEELVRHAEDNRIKVAGPLVLDYDSDNLQVMGASGFDLFGGMIPARLGEKCGPVVCHWNFLISSSVELFQKLEGLMKNFFFITRKWICHGAPGWRVNRLRWSPSAHIHHQGASSGERAVENRTNETKRFYANRNQLLVIFKNAQSLLLVLALSQTALITVEAVVGTFLARRFSFFYQALLKTAGGLLAVAAAYF